MPMNHPFAEHLPWRVAAFAGLMVGAISLVYGADVWTSLLRVAGAFLLFALVGLGLRAALQSALPPAAPGRRFESAPSEQPDEPSVSSNANDINSDTLK